MDKTKQLDFSGQDTRWIIRLITYSSGLILKIFSLAARIFDTTIRKKKSLAFDFIPISIPGNVA